MQAFDRINRAFWDLSSAEQALPDLAGASISDAQTQLEAVRAEMTREGQDKIDNILSDLWMADASIYHEFTREKVIRQALVELKVLDEYIKR